MGESSILEHEKHFNDIRSAIVLERNVRISESSELRKRLDGGDLLALPKDNGAKDREVSFDDLLAQISRAKGMSNESSVGHASCSTTDSNLLEETQVREEERQYPRAIDIEEKIAHESHDQGSLHSYSSHSTAISPRSPAGTRSQPNLHARDKFGRGRGSLRTNPPLVNADAATERRSLGLACRAPATFKLS